MVVTFVPVTHIGQKRKINEDNLWPATAWHPYSAQDDYGMLFIVADGMGGHGAGDVASQIAIDVITREYYNLGSEYADIGERLRLAIQIAHRRICEQAGQATETENMGTTVVTAVVKYDEMLQQGQVWVAWAGDSRAYRLRQGRLQQLTRDHSRVWPLVEAGEITWDDLHFHPLRSRVTNALTATRADVLPEVQQFDLLLGDRLLLCSDGLSGEVRPGELEHILATYPAEQAALLLVDQANAPTELVRDGQAIQLDGGNDNISLIIIDVDSKERHPAAMPASTGSTTIVSPTSRINPARLKPIIFGGLALLVLIVASVVYLLRVANPLQAPVANMPTPALPVATSQQQAIVIAVETVPTATTTLVVPKSTAVVPTPLNSTQATLLPTVTREPTSSPTVPPTPTAIPAVITSTQTITNGTLPVPLLLKPEPDLNGAVMYDAGKGLTFTWLWPGELTDNLSFEVRVWRKGVEPVGVHDARLLKDDPTFQQRNDIYSVELVLQGTKGVSGTGKDYYWSVGVVRIKPEYEWLGIEAEPWPIGLAVSNEKAQPKVKSTP